MVIRAIFINPLMTNPETAASVYAKYMLWPHELVCIGLRPPYALTLVTLDRHWWS